MILFKRLGIGLLLVSSVFLLSGSSIIHPEDNITLNPEQQSALTKKFAEQEQAIKGFSDNADYWRGTK